MSSPPLLRPGVTVVEGVDSPAEGCTRTLRVYLPAGVGPGEVAGVLVLLDGQNLFARSRAGAYGTWAADEAMDALVARGDVGPWAVVGVDHRGVHRIADDTPWPDPRVAVTPRGHLFAEFLSEDLPAWIGEHLPPGRDPARRALAGSSLGGLASLYVAWLHPLAYSRVAGFSPTVMWGGDRLARSWVTRGDGPRRLYLDAGVDERFDAGGFQLDYGGAVRALADHLRAIGWDDDALRVELDPEGSHDEATWARRFPAAARWLLADLPPLTRAPPPAR